MGQFFYLGSEVRGLCLSLLSIMFSAVGMTKSLSRMAVVGSEQLSFIPAIRGIGKCTSKLTGQVSPSVPT